MIAYQKHIRPFLLLVFITSFFIVSCGEVTASTNVDQIRDQVIEAVQERQKLNQQKQTETIEEHDGLKEMDEQHEGQPQQQVDDSHKQEDQAKELPEDTTAWTGFGGFVSFRRVSGQWYIHLGE